MSKPISRRGFIKQLNCAAVGTSAILNTLLNLKLANSVSAQGGPLDNKALVCIFLSGGCDSFNLLVPWEQTAYNAYAASRGPFGSTGGLALDRNVLRQLSSPSANYGLHPSCANLQAMANGTNNLASTAGDFTDKRCLSFVANIGTLIQPITKAQFIAWENGNNAALPVPKALFSHSDQIEQWQTAVPQGLSQLNGWAGRCADILHSYYNTGANSMSISLGGNNVFQVGSATQQFVITPSGALSFEGDSGGSAGNPLQLKNAALRSALDQTYTNLLTESFSHLTRGADDAQQLFQAQFDSPGADLGAPVNALFPNSDLANRLKAVVKTIKIRSQLGLRRQTFFVNYGGWDHHGELLNTQAGMLATLDAAIGAFQQALYALGLQNDVVSFTCSDFSRTLRSNGYGTDHAWGANAMVFGGKVKAGEIFGAYPGLALDGPDDVGRGGRLLPSLSADVYFAELLKWFGVSAGNMSYVLPNIANFWNPGSGTAPLGFILP